MTAIEWNQNNPIGQKVLVTKDGGIKVSSQTKSEAFTTPAGIDVIFVEGISGYYLLSRIERSSKHGE